MGATLKIVILLGALQFSMTFDISGVEQQLEKSTRSFADKELKISKMIELCDAYLKYSSSNLKASNIAKNLSTALDNGRNSLNALKSIKNHYSFESFGDFSTCEYISSRQSTIEIDLSRFDYILSDAVANLTELYQLRNQITSNFASNFKALLKFKSKALTVVFTIRDFGKTADEYLSYLRLLYLSKDYLKKLKVCLNAAATSLNCSTASTSFQDKGQQIDVKLENFEEGLKGKKILLN